MRLLQILVLNITLLFFSCSTGSSIKNPNDIKVKYWGLIDVYSIDNFSLSDTGKIHRVFHGIDTSKFYPINLVLSSNINSVKISDSTITRDVMNYVNGEEVCIPDHCWSPDQQIDVYN